MGRNKEQKLKHLPPTFHLFFPGSTSFLHSQVHFVSPSSRQQRGQHSGQCVAAVLCCSMPFALLPTPACGLQGLPSFRWTCSSLGFPWAAGSAGHGHLSLCDSPQGLQGNHALVPGAPPPHPTPSLLFILLFFTILRKSWSPAAGLSRTPPWSQLESAGAVPTSPHRISCGSSLPAPQHRHQAEEVRRVLNHALMYLTSAWPTLKSTWSRSDLKGMQLSRYWANGAWHTNFRCALDVRKMYWNNVYVKLFFFYNLESIKLRTSRPDSYKTE